MNENPPNYVFMGPGIRNICDKLINELNSSIIKIAEKKGDSTDKIKDFKFLVKTNFYSYIKRMPKILKCYKNIDRNGKVIQALNVFYDSFENILNQLVFINSLSELYTFPKFDIDNTIDLIFDGCTYNMRQKLIKSNLFNSIVSKNLYDNNDVGLLLGNDLNTIDFNKVENNNNINIVNFNNEVNALLDKENPITKIIIENLNKKIEEFNKYIISNKEEFNENNFELFLDEKICIKLYGNFLIKFILVQKRINNNIYFFLPIEISYSNEIINLNDKKEIFQDKNKCSSRKDLQFFIDKFKPKIINPKKNKTNEINVEIISFTKDDFLEKCLLFKDFTKTLFNDKFINLKSTIIDYVNKYDIPINIEDSSLKMDIDNNEEKDNDIIELTFYYNFAINIKRKNEFYIKFIYNKNYPTIIKIIFSHHKLNYDKEKNQVNYCIYNEQIEKIILFDIKWIKNEIKKCYEDYKYILLNWIYKKLLYLYPIFFDFGFVTGDSYLIFGLKSSRNKNIISKKLFSLYINDLGKLSYNNLYTSKLFGDDFKEINSMITNFLKNENNEKEQDDIIYKFNQYMNIIILEKIFTFSGLQTKVIELNNETKQMILYIYNPYYTDKNISTYFDIRCKIYKCKKEKDNINKKDNEESYNYYVNCFEIKEFKLVCVKNNDQNKKIFLDCFERNNQNMLAIIKKVEFNTLFKTFLMKLINDINNKYELFMIYASEIIKVSEKPESVLELNKPLEITNMRNFENKEEEWYELSVDKNNMDFFKLDYKRDLLKYFNKIKFSKENNVFQLYLNPEVFKQKYNKKILKFQIENYSSMFHYYIFGYDYKEDYISIIILSKIKIGYINIIELVFESFIPRIISYMDKIFSLIDYLAINEPIPVMTACPLLLTLQMNYLDKNHNIDFKKHINFKITDKDKEKPYNPDGNYNNVFMIFVKEFGTEIITSEHDYNDKKYFMNKSKFFYLNYSIYELLLNELKIKYSLIMYPYNHFEQVNCNIYLINKDFNVLELISLNNLSLTVQVRSDNSLFLEFRDNKNIDISINTQNRNINFGEDFVEELKNENFNYNIIGPDEKNSRIIIIIDDKDKHENITLLEKFRKLVNIFIILSNK